MKGAIAIRKPVLSVVKDYSVTPVVAGAWLEVHAALPYACSVAEIFDNGGVPLRIATGAAGSEVALPYTLPPGNIVRMIPIEIPAGVRLAISPIGTNLSDGDFIINLFQ